MNLLRTVYYYLPPRQRRLARRLIYFPIDMVDIILKRRPQLVPPKGMIFTGQGNFVTAGNELLLNLINTCNLHKDHYVLDVGCGIGRVARPLTQYLSDKGRYEGFDVVNDGINWCKKHYKTHTNFNFKYIPLENDLYNLDSNEQAAHFSFPYNDEIFDIVVLTSVFTHMQPEEVKNYFREIARVLKPGGRCFATFFVINNRSESYLNNCTDPFFRYRYGDYFLHNNRVKNANIAYRISFIEDTANTPGLKIHQIHEGWWSGIPAEKCLNFQDIIVFNK